MTNNSSNAADHRLKIVAYLGDERPQVETDFGRLLISRLRETRHELCAVVLCDTDPLIGYLNRNKIKHITLPGELNKTLSQIKKKVSSSDFAGTLERFTGQLHALGADLGITIWSRWIPPAVYRIPPMGFINYHPAPLPELRGMEPDTFAILQNRKSIFGTVHRINREFDCGDILRRTKTIPIRVYDTPLSVLTKLNAEGITAMLRAVDDLYHGKLRASRQLECNASDATRKMARREAYIDWGNDSNDMIERRFRAFCGQDIGIRLKARIKGELYEVIRLETHDSKKIRAMGAAPGTVLGSYRAKGAFHKGKIIATLDGAAVIITGGTITPLTNASISHPESQQKYILSARAHRSATTLAEILTSINQRN